MEESVRDPQIEEAKKCALICSKIAAECKQRAFEALKCMKSALDEVCDSGIG
jgi:hypothetical protein